MEGDKALEKENVTKRENESLGMTGLTRDVSYPKVRDVSYPKVRDGCYWRTCSSPENERTSDHWWNRWWKLDQWSETWQVNPDEERRLDVGNLLDGLMKRRQKGKTTPKSKTNPIQREENKEKPSVNLRTMRWKKGIRIKNISTKHKLSEDFSKQNRYLDHPIRS